MSRLLNSASHTEQANIIDVLYNKTGTSVRQFGWPAAAPLGAIMFAYTPEENVSMVSLNHRIHLLILAGRMTGDEFENMSHGQKVVETRGRLLELKLDVDPDAPNLAFYTYFMYRYPPFREFWMPTRRRGDKNPETQRSPQRGQKHTFRVNKKNKGDVT